MIQMEHGSQFDHHGIAKVCTMISNNILWDTKPGYNMIEHKEGYLFTSFE